MLMTLLSDQKLDIMELRYITNILLAIREERKLAKEKTANLDVIIVKLYKLAKEWYPEEAKQWVNSWPEELK